MHPKLWELNIDKLSRNMALCNTDAPTIQLFDCLFCTNSNTGSMCYNLCVILDKYMMSYVKSTSVYDKLCGDILH